MAKKKNIQEENIIIRPVIKVSVRTLVEFVLRSGDIDNRRHVSPESAMLEGGRIHRMIQRRMGAGYQAEVTLSHVVAADDFDLLIDGRADGIFEEASLTIIDEIKGIYRDVKRLEEPVAVHLAQAKCYGAIFLLQNSVDNVGVQMTYCNIDTEEIKRFRFEYDRAELLAWFEELVLEYKKWAQFRYDWRKIRQESIHELSFPFEFREGQKELAASVYRTIYHGKKLFLEAPTGVGKTISTLFPAIKALGENLGENIFYLTAKTLTGTVASGTYDILRKKGLKMKTVSITAKEKMCRMEQMECNPDACPYAKGHFDRINDAIYTLLNEQDDFSRETVLEYADRFMVCPFEFCLDMSLFADGILCDYNYVFDPNVYLRRFFLDGAKGEYIFLVDEAHNLIDRAREMYSAVLLKDDFLEARRLVKPFDDKLAAALYNCNNILLSYLRESEGAVVRPSVDPFLIALTRCAGLFDEFMEDDEGSALKNDLLDFYFNVRHFLNMAELMADDYVIYTQPVTEGSLMIKLLCVDPSKNLSECLERGASTIFFSATLLPVTYYIDLISGDRNDYAVYAKSSFDPEKRGVFIVNDVSSKYTMRGPALYKRIAECITAVVEKKEGNYLVFFPSYRFLQDVYETLMGMVSSMDEIGFDIVCQEPSMTEAEREAFLNRFVVEEDEGDAQETNVEEVKFGINFDIELEEESDDGRKSATLVGFCVMGGIFSEGIDLRKDSLIGALIVGTGLPQVGPELEIMKDYFDERGEKGFDYVYRIPGMNKVLQSAGRVIRTAEDVGVVALLDDRFLSSTYKSMFPKEWEKYGCGNTMWVADAVGQFWDKYGEKE